MSAKYIVIFYLTESFRDCYIECETLSEATEIRLELTTKGIVAEIHDNSN